MNFKDLNDAIDTGLRAQKNYQFVVICHLVNQRGLKDIKENICETLRKKNQNSCDVKHYMNCPVWNVLKGKDIITIEGKLITLNIELTNDQRSKITSKCRGLFKN